MSSEPPCTSRFLGEFRELGHGRPDGPSLHTAVREVGSPDELQLVQYLNSGAVLAATASPVHDILSPRQEFINWLRLLTDGQWFWHSDLAHYVEHYHVALDEQFVQHAAQHNWTPPTLTPADLSKIEEAFFDEEDA
ncbi:hypothetical protein [Kitasatospora herbaricolor]|uniref:hypothetical protein n=1 Tax=Kitasatospora herbaricolor TaxID=68217 RepID=UPI0036D98AD9